MIRIIKRLFFRQIAWCRYKTFDGRKIIYKGRSYNEYLNEALSESRPNITNKEKKELCYNIFKQWLWDGTRPDEYLLYRYDNKTIKEREEYMPQVAKDTILLNYYGSNSMSIFEQLKNKFFFYQILSTFFKREAICIYEIGDYNMFAQFCANHNSFICKLLEGHCGVGVQIIHQDSDNRSVNEIFDSLVSQGKWIVEELIQQHESISLFNRSSINTVRFPSFRHGNDVRAAYPCMRFGRKGSVVDNAGQGGVFVSVDIETGVIISNGYDELGHIYECHPDSNVKFKGFIIPHWQELVAESREAHLKLPEEHTYVAFDYALSNKGWAIVEGNWGDFILQQASLERGLKKDFLTLLKGK